MDVSVVIPTYHREQYLPKAIRSALAQDGVSVEVIVVDDSGTASARKAVSQINDPRVRYIPRDRPAGSPAVPRNEGMKLAQGRYLSFLDDDDLLEPGGLAALTAALDANPVAGMAFGITIPFGDNPQELKAHQEYHEDAARVARNLQSNRALVANLVFRDSIICNSACIGRREAVFASGGFDGGISISEDVDFWARVARQSGGFEFVDRPVVRYRTGLPSLTHGANLQEKQRSSFARIHRKYRDENGFVEYVVMKVWARTLLHRRVLPGGTPY